jgi:predicted O-methyltransferase YrrM
MMIISEEAEAYAKKFTSPLDNILADNEAYTLREHQHSIMHSGHVQGIVLEMLSNMIRPEKILEIGTFTGFSALCLSKGLLEGGMLHTIEIREEDASLAQDYFNKAGAADKIKLHIGHARSIIPSLKEEWDMVFIDADKVNYIEYYLLTLPLVKKGGFIIADNVLFHGQVLVDDPVGKNAKAIHAFNEYVASDENVQQVILTVRDGLSVIRKL